MFLEREGFSHDKPHLLTARSDCIKHRASYRAMFYQQGSIFILTHRLGLMSKLKLCQLEAMSFSKDFAVPFVASYDREPVRLP